MFDRYTTHKSHTTVNETIQNILNVPDKYDVYNHNENDDVNRMDFHLKNRDNISSHALLSDILPHTVSVINKTIENFMLKEFNGTSKQLDIDIKEKNYRLYYRHPMTIEALDILKEALENKYNIEVVIWEQFDILSLTPKIIIYIRGRLNK